MAVKLVQKVSKDNTVGLVVGIIALLLLLLFVVIGFKIASDRRAKNLGQSNVEEVETRLADNSADSLVRLYMEGGVSADEEFYSIEMLISARSRTIRVMNGYQNVEQRSDGLPNNQVAYEAFLKALDSFDFTESRIDKSGLGWREACPKSKRYSFALYNGPDQVFDRWHSFCDGTRYGEYGGRVSSVYQLFRDQFPDYNTYTRGIRL